MLIPLRSFRFKSKYHKTINIYNSMANTNWLTVESRQRDSRSR